MWSLYIMSLNKYLNTSKKRESVSVLAKLLASENISIEHKKTETAYFDTLNRVLVLPIWKDMEDYTYAMLVGHEVGHALFSPGPKELQDSIEKYSLKYVNILEDSRIDRLIKQKFPGLKRDYFRAFEKFYNDKFFGDLTPSDIANMDLIDRMNVDDKSGMFYDVKFTDEEQVFVDRKNKMTSFEDVLALCKDLKTFAEEKEKQEEESQPDDVKSSDDGIFDGEGLSGGEGQSGDEEDTEESSLDDMSDEEIEKVSENLIDVKSSDKGEDKDKKEKQEKESSRVSVGGVEGTRGTGQNQTTAQKSPVKDSIEIFANPMNTLIDEKANERLYVNFPTDIDSSKSIVDYKIVLEEVESHFLTEDEQFTRNKHHIKEYISPFTQAGLDSEKFIHNSKKSVMNMVKEFEMKKRADEHKRAQTSKTGVIDTNKLTFYKTEEDIFKKVTNIADGKNHGLVMFVDWSGSMGAQMDGTIKQMMHLVLFCRQARIPYEVYSFTDASRGYNFHYKSHEDNPIKYKTKDLVICQRLQLRNYFSSRMNGAEFKRAMKNMQALSGTIGYNRKYYMRCPSTDGLGGTPLNDAIIVATDLIKQFKSKNKLQIVNSVFLTDGDSCPIDGHFDTDYEGDDSGYSSSRGKHYKNFHTGLDLFVTDPITKKSFEMVGYRGRMTTILLEILKSRLQDINVIGFFLLPRNGIEYAISRFFDNHVDREKLKSQWKRDNCLIAKQKGYTEYFLLKGGKSLQEEEGEMDVEEGASIAKIAKAFNKIHKVSNHNKVILSRFVDLIS